MVANNGGLADRKDAVLVVIDMQERLLRAIHEGEGVLNEVSKLIKAAHVLDVPVILTEQKKLGKTVADLPQLPPPIEKVSFDCFLNDDFVDQLESLGRGTIIFAGVEAHICVAQTAIHALEGYGVHLVANGTSSRNPEDARLGVKRCRDEGVTITSTEMVIYELLQKAGTEEFTRILPLVK